MKKPFKIKNALIRIKQVIETVDSNQINEVQSKFIKILGQDKLEKKQIIEILNNESLFDTIEVKKSIRNLVKETLELLSRDEEIEKKNILYYRTEFENNRIEIYLKKPKDYVIPPEVYDFIYDVEDFQDIIIETSKNEKEIKKYLSSLFGIVEVGGTSTYSNFAQKRLEGFKKNFVAAKWWSLKLPFVKDLGSHMFIAVVIYLVIIFLLKTELIKDNFYNSMNIDKYYLINWFFILMGAAIGSWVSFSVIRQTKTIEEIKSLKDNIPNAFYRLTLVSLVSSIFYLLFIIGFINIEIGNGVINTKNVGQKDFGNLALIVGVFLGFSENSIGYRLKEKIESFTSKF